jgi:hypothetical protein
LKLCICVHFALGCLLGSIHARFWRQFIFSRRINEVRDRSSVSLSLLFNLAFGMSIRVLKLKITRAPTFFGRDFLVTVLTLSSLSPIILRSISAQ